MIIIFIGIGILLLALLITAMVTHSNGFFTQKRIGQHGKIFTVYKLRTLHANTQQLSPWGTFLRSTKLDELPQILNLLKGDLVLVGPRPDVPGYADELQGEDRIILQVKPHNGNSYQILLRRPCRALIMKIQMRIWFLRQVLRIVPIS